MQTDSTIDGGRRRKVRKGVEEKNGEKEVQMIWLGQTDGEEMRKSWR